jgi:hypothetical protein
VRLSAGRPLVRWQTVSLAAESASLAAAPAGGVVAEVRDNIVRDRVRPFYGVVRGGMGPGVLAFTDKPNPRWEAVPGAVFPDRLLGADLIRTYHSFRGRRDFGLTLTLTGPAEVFVLHAAARPPPDWLAARFADTGLRVRVGPWHAGLIHEDDVEVDPDGRLFLTYSVWRAEAPAGEFRLGPPRMRDQPGPTMMYGLAVRAVSP